MGCHQRITVFGLLLENGTAPTVNGVSVSSGDEHLLRALADESLQAVSNAITAPVESANPALVGAPRVEVMYTNGTRIQLPKWVTEHRGHDLLQMFQATWGGPRVINIPRLVKAIRRVRLIPRDLATLFSQLQA